MQRRNFFSAAGIGTAAAAAMKGSRSAEAGDPSFMNNVPDPLLAGKELPTFKFELEKSEGKVIGSSFGKEATVEQLPISKGIAGVSMKLEPGAMRELHWHATAAEWAFVIEGRVRTTVIDPQGDAETNDFEPGDVWYFPRGHGHMLECLGDKPVPLHPDLRQRLLLGVRHLQHHRLDRPHPQGASWRRISACPSRPSTDFPRTRSTSPAGRCRRREPARPLQGWRQPAAATHKYRAPRASRHIGHFKGGREWRVDSDSFPDLEDDHRRDPRPRAGRPARAALAPDGRRVAVRHRRRQSASRCSARTAATGPRRSRKGDVGYIPQGYGHSIENVGDKPCRVLIGFNSGIYETIDLSQWIAGNPADVLATNFGKPQSLFEKFPRHDVFITSKHDPNTDRMRTGGQPLHIHNPMTRSTVWREPETEADPDSSRRIPMFETKNDLSLSIREKSIELLNARLADCVDLQTQVKQAHWNVKGREFIGLHKLFDEINDAVRDYVDEIAERAVQLGGVARGTARMVAERSTLKEYPVTAVDCRDHVEALSSALAAFGKIARKGIDDANGFGDLDTADLFTEVSRGIDKWLWFVEAHAQSSR